MKYYCNNTQIACIKEDCIHSRPHKLDRHGCNLGYCTGRKKEVACIKTSRLRNGTEPFQEIQGIGVRMPGGALDG